MSNIYVHAPKTKGKVILVTNYGDIEIELWSKESPKAVRNFVQLCLEGFYDNMIFHRIIHNFIIQTGKPKDKEFESIYGDYFPLETHSRLKFAHRGIVACAGQNGKNDSQFFITLDKCDYLNFKHTIFGKVVGDTIFNVLKIGEIDTDKNDAPSDMINPPRILKTEVLFNPFPDIVPRIKQVKKEEKKKPKAVKNFSLLSFGDEVEEFEDVPEITIKSSHDVLNDPKLSKKEAVDVSKLKKVEVKSNVKNVIAALKKKVSSKTTGKKVNLVKDEKEDETKKDEQKELKKDELKKEETKKEESKKEQPKKEIEEDVKKGKLKFKKRKSDKLGKNYLEEQRKKYLSKKRKMNEDRENEALEKVKRFTEKLLNSSNNDWKSHKLKFKKEGDEKIKNELESLIVQDSKQDE